MTNNGDLEAARLDVEERCFSADDAGNQREYRLVDSLYDVAELVCRIADDGQSGQYRASNAGRLVTAALTVRCIALQHLTGPGEQADELSEAVQLEKDLDEEIDLVMSAIAGRHRHGTQLSCSDITGLLRALQRLVDWTETIAAMAVADDPVE